MDKIKDIIEETVNKIKKDPNFAKKFQKDPVKALEDVTGLDLPNDKIDEIITAVQAKIKLDDNKIVNKLKDIFK